MTPRKYTGVSDGISPTNSARIGLVAFVRQIERRSNGALWNNGTFANRPKRGKDSMSVHATGRAVDLSYRKTSTKGVPNGRLIAVEWIKLLTKPENAEALGIEMILDYWTPPFGRGWKCDRGKWERYKKPTISGAPHGDWIHVELSPSTADNPAAIRESFRKMFPQDLDEGEAS
jgi:hypothetical protein